MQELPTIVKLLQTGLDPDMVCKDLGVCTDDKGKSLNLHHVSVNISGISTWQNIGKDRNIKLSLAMHLNQNRGSSHYSRNSENLHVVCVVAIEMMEDPAEVNETPDNKVVSYIH